MNSGIYKNSKVIGLAKHPIMMPAEVVEMLSALDENINTVYKQNIYLRELLHDAYLELNKPWWKRIF